jgi:hypothetical protein
MGWLRKTQDWGKKGGKGLLGPPKKIGRICLFSTIGNNEKNVSVVAHTSTQGD